MVIDPTAAAAALEKPQNDPEPEARFMRMAGGSKAPAYNVQTAVDAEHGIIVAQQVTTEVTDQCRLLPMAEAAKQALDAPDRLKVLADTGYSNGGQAAACESLGIVPHVPAKRNVNNQGDGTLFDRTAFVYDQKTNTYRCPGNKTLRYKQVVKDKHMVQYAAAVADCSQCALKPRCTTTERRSLKRHQYEDSLERMNRRATPQLMRLRRCTVERPFALLKYVIFGHPRFLLRGRDGAEAETSLAVMAYNLKTMIRTLGGKNLLAALAY
jgi:transposase